MRVEVELEEGHLLGEECREEGLEAFVDGVLGLGEGDLLLVGVGQGGGAARHEGVTVLLESGELTTAAGQPITG